MNQPQFAVFRYSEGPGTFLVNIDEIAVIREMEEGIEITLKNQKNMRLLSATTMAQATNQLIGFYIMEGCNV